MLKRASDAESTLRTIRAPRPARSWRQRLALAILTLGLATACTAPTLPSYGNYAGAPRAGEPVPHIIPYKPEVPIR